MVRTLYMDDSYLKSWNVNVNSVKDGKYFVLDKTVLYQAGRLTLR